MYLTLTAQELLSLYSILDRAKESCDFKHHEVIESITSQVESKILSCLNNVNAENSKKIFQTWQKKESEKIQSLEAELNNMKLANQISDNTRILKKKNKF